jgi:cell division protein FtsB
VKGGEAVRIAQGRRWLGAWRTRSSSPGTVTTEAFEALSARVAHLEAEIEGLQDAVHRQVRLHDQRIAELQKRTEPGEIARELSRDARERGL